MVGEDKMFEEDKFSIRTLDGEKKEFYKLIVFYSKKTDNSYIIYTDKFDNYDSVNIYGSILIKDFDKIKLLEIIEDKDFEEIKKALLELKINAVYRSKTMSGDVNNV